MIEFSKSNGATKTGETSYKIAVSLAIVAAFFLLFLTGAVGVIGVQGDHFDLFYFGVVTVGIVGAIISRFQPFEMAVALFATSVTQVLVVVIALIIGKQHSPVSSVFEIVALNGFFVVLFIGSALLFLLAARKQSS